MVRSFVSVATRLIQLISIRPICGLRAENSLCRESALDLKQLRVDVSSNLSVFESHKFVFGGGESATETTQCSDHAKQSAANECRGRSQLDLIREVCSLVFHSVVLHR